MKRLQLPVLFIVLLVCIGCGSGEVKVTARIVSDDINLELDDETSVTYTIEAEEKNNECKAKDVTVETKLVFFGTHADVVTVNDMGDIDAGDSKTKTFTITFSAGDTLVIGIQDVDIGDADCPITSFLS